VGPKGGGPRQQLACSLVNENWPPTVVVLNFMDHNNDFIFSKLFWSDWNRGSPKIEWSNLDGSQRAIFLHESVQLPNYLAFDYELDELCWTDAGNKKLGKTDTILIHFSILPFIFSDNYGLIFSVISR
jgi:hypothetical protein